MAHKTSRPHTAMAAITHQDVKYALEHACENAGPEMMRLANSIFRGSPFAMTNLANLFHAMCWQPIEFGNTHRQFYQALQAVGAFEEWTPASREPAFHAHVTWVAATSSRSKLDGAGTAFKLSRFLEGMCTLLLGPDLQGFAQWMTDIPLRIASAFLFYTENVHLSVFPARRWMIERLMSPDCQDANMWMRTDTASAMVQSEFALQMDYMPSSGFGQEQPHNMNPSVVMTMHQLDMANPGNFCSTLCEPDTEARDDGIKREKYISVMIPLIMNRLLRFHDPAFPCVDINSKIGWIRRHMELVLWMLGGYSVGACLELIARTVSPETLAQLQSIVDEMRAYILKEPGQPVDPFIKHLAKSTSQTRNTQAGVVRICKLLTKASRRKAGLTPRYVGTTEVTFFDFVTGLMRDFQLGQLNKLTRWCQAVEKTNGCAPNIDQMLREGSASEYVAMMNRGISVWRLPPSVHRARLAWSVDLICELTPGLPDFDKLCVLVGYDNIGSYLVMPRSLINILRMRMIVLSLVSSNFSKTTAWYPLLVQLLVCSYVDPDKPLAEGEPFSALISDPVDDCARHCVAMVIAHWLRIKKRGANSNGGDFEGMPAIGSFAAKMYQQLHNITEMLFRPVHNPADGPLDVMAHVPQLNALRSFIMIGSLHYLPLSVIQEIAYTPYVTDPSFDAEQLKRMIDLIDAMRSLAAIYESTGSVGSAGVSPAHVVECDASSESSASAGKRAAPGATPAPKRQRGRPPTAARVAADTAAATQALFHDSKHLVGSTSGATTAQFLGGLSEGNQLRACADDASRNALLNAMMYEFCISSGRVDWLMAFSASTGVAMEDCSRALYLCSPDSLEMWQHSSTCIRQGLHEQAQRPSQDRYRLLSCFLPNGDNPPAQKFDMLIDVLSSLEFSVCQRHNAKGGRAKPPKHVHENERTVASQTSEINDHMGRYYQRRTAGAFPMPVSCSMTQEDQICVVELLHSFLLVDIASDPHSQVTLAKDTPAALNPERTMLSSNRDHPVAPLILSTLDTFEPFFPTTAALRARPDSAMLYRLILQQQQQLSGKANDANAGQPAVREY